MSVVSTDNGSNDSTVAAVSAYSVETSDDDNSLSENFEFIDYQSLVAAEIELIQRVFEIRQNFTNSSDSERLVEPILQRISKIKSEKLVFEQKFNLI